MKSGLPSTDHISSLTHLLHSLLDEELSAEDDEEVREAALQYVRKISGFNTLSKANEVAFYAAVDEIAAASSRLLASTATNAPPRNREVEAAKARARAARRYGQLIRWFCHSYGREHGTCI